MLRVSCCKQDPSYLKESYAGYLKLEKPPRPKNKFFKSAFHLSFCSKRTFLSGLICVLYKEIEHQLTILESVGPCFSSKLPTSKSHLIPVYEITAMNRI